MSAITPTPVTKRILLIVNPVSGKMRSRSGLFDILDELYRNPDETPAPERRVTVCTTLYRGHATELAASAAAEGFDQILCCGGDGTLNEVLNGLLSTPPDTRLPLGYIPAGSTNDFAASIGLPSSLRTAARVAVSNPASALDIGHFLPAAAEHSARYFSYIASFGAFTETSYTTSQSFKNAMGHLAYILSSIRDISKITARHVAVQLAEGTALEGDYIFGAMCNTTSAGGVVKLPASVVSMSDGRLELFLIRSPRTPIELNKIISSLLSTNYADNPMFEFWHTAGASFHFADQTVWSLDGEEAAGGTEVEIRCLPSAVMLDR